MICYIGFIEGTNKSLITVRFSENLNLSFKKKNHLKVDKVLKLYLDSFLLRPKTSLTPLVFRSLVDPESIAYLAL